jgi:hypothetical protein
MPQGIGDFTIVLPDFTDMAACELSEISPTPQKSACGKSHQIGNEKRAASQKIGDRITLFAAAMEAAADGEEQTHASPEDGP